MVLTGRSRSRFLIGAAASAGSYGILTAPARAAEFEIKCASSLAVDHPSTVRLRQMWAAIEKESNGRIHATFTPAGALGSEASLFTQLRINAIQVFLLNGGTLAASVPLADIGYLGFAFKDSADGQRLLDGPLGDYLRNEVTAKGLHPLRTIWNGGMLQIASGTHPIRTPADLKGFKIRTASSKIAVDLFRELGASPTAISVEEAYTALSTKLVDGVSAPLPAIETARFYEVQKYISMTNHEWVGMWLVCNGTFWSSLPPDLQEIFERNNRKYGVMEGRDVEQLSASLVDKIGRQGLQVMQVDQAPFRPLLHNYYATWANTFGPTAWGLLESSLGRQLR